MPKGNLFYGQIYVSTIKRALDIFSGIVLGLFFLPICLLVALIIKLDSSGPVFADTPSRVGKNGRRFKMFKFRSMIKNAHQLLRTDPKFKALYQEYKKSSYKLYNDPRVTRFGKFIRKYSLDEVPPNSKNIRQQKNIWIWLFKLNQELPVFGRFSGAVRFTSTNVLKWMLSM